MEPKKMIIVLTVTVAILFAIIIGSSYAWYAYANAETNVSGKTTDINPTIVFTQTDEVNFKTIMPINDDDRYVYAGKNSFTITINENLKDYSKGIEISLNNIKMSDELKITNYKYELLENNIAISSGNFSNIGNNNKIILKPMSELNVVTYPTTYNYDLLIWLSEDGTNQNDLMNKSFSAKININSAIKR